MRNIYGMLINESLPRARRLLIIGGTGFFGRSLLCAHRRGILNDYAIESIGILARRAPEDLPHVPMHIGDIASLNALPAGYDAIVYAALPNDPLREESLAFRGVDNFCRLLADLPAATRPSAVFASSGAVYGRHPPEVTVFDESLPPGLPHPDQAKEAYARAKRAAEACIVDYIRRFGLRIAVARCFAFVGLHLPRDRHFAVGNFMADALAGSQVRFHASHPVYRSYMHADDLSRLLVHLALQASSENMRPYNIGAATGLETAATAGHIAAAFGVPLAAPPERNDRPIDRYIPSVTRQNALLPDIADTRVALDRYIAQMTLAMPSKVCIVGHHDRANFA